MFQIPILPETEAALRARALALGADAEDYAARLLDHVLAAPSADDLAEPLRGGLTVGLGIDGMNQLTRVTEDVFPGGRLTIEPSADPEHPETKYIVFRVALTPPGFDTRAVIEDELRWYRRAAEVVPDALERLRLVVE